MRSFSNTASSNNCTAVTENKSNRPDWRKRVQEQRKSNHDSAEKTATSAENSTRRPLNCDPNLFSSSFNHSTSTEITYLDDEDDLAESYFPEARRSKKLGLPCARIGSDSLKGVSGYNFDELIKKNGQ
eukprot:CAMPEP_0113622494 /NCGR_PEP_ID=MMETSP0017_2-20120614/11529_1 /TAXON_ID=2856 /ORGANISM="Cylindrotheca closterium" /LENGTH=127 /DNA_ID=CAMNT_0000532331 /DNA_START=348 /DNA_END=731 /DNA_ORIENTATION=- /assembly_acc=CAM_ASM_000147